MMRYKVLLALVACAGTWPLAAGAEDCAQPSPGATWQAYLDASIARDSPRAVRCLTRELQVEAATFGVVAIDMGISSLEIVGAVYLEEDGTPDIENAAAEAARLRRGLEEIYDRNGLAEVMAEVREPLLELAWDGDPELVDEDVERKITAAVDRGDPLRLIADLWSYTTRELSVLLEGEEGPRQLPIDALQNLAIEGDVARGQASGQSVRFRRVDGLWYIEEKPLGY